MNGKWIVSVSDTKDYSISLHTFATREDARAFSRKVKANPFLKDWDVGRTWRIR